MKKILFAFFLLLAIPAAAQAQTAPAPLPPEALSAQSYLQTITTAQARFKQTAPDGTQTTGTFYLRRPGKLRFEYDPPAKDFVVADGAFIYFWDGQLQQQSNAPIGQTLADFLLRRDLRFSGDITVTDVRRSTGGLLLITLVQTADPHAGSLTLCFSDNPMQLVKWRVVDATGAITEVALTGLQINIKLSDNLFYYRAPDKAGNARYND